MTDLGTDAHPGDLLGRYRTVPGSFDELADATGQVRPHWAPLLRSLEVLGRDELEHRRTEVARILRDDGVTYNAYDGAVTRATDWMLDPLPLVLTAAEWAGVECGVVQRAELLNLVLDDLYGSQTLVRDGVVPPEVVHGHRGFLRAAHRIRLPGSHQLVSYAAELARDADGRFRVVGDFAQAPSGVGYAHENRRVLARVLPHLHRSVDVHRLAPFFRALRGALHDVAPLAAEEPRVVVLSPGPLNETYFDHAYLANQLGCTLVEGADLTVRRGHVHLRALGGLEPVHVILRRVDGWYCDPLELKPDSQLGVPGLVEAARRANVSVVNPFGAGVLENGGLAPFLPAIARRFLGGDLMLPSAETWWCGDPAGRSHVLARLGELVITPIARRRGRHSIHGWELSDAERAELADRIAMRPYAFTASEPAPFSSAPCVTAGGLEARPVLLRSFAVAHDGAYVTLPGGLARVAAQPGEAVRSARDGGLSKDVWVLAEEPDTAPVAVGTDLRSDGADPVAEVSARAAENLFWLGRYAERSEATIRLLKAVLDRRGFSSVGSGRVALDLVLEALTDLTATAPGFAGPEGAERRSAPGGELWSLAADAERVGSLAFSLRSLVAAGRAVGEQLSGDTWPVIAAIERNLCDLGAGTAEAEGVLRRVLVDVNQSLLALAGLAHENMVRDAGWCFMDAGRRLERGLLLARLLRSTVITVRPVRVEELVLESVLVATDSIITYRRRNGTQPDVPATLELLLLDEENPRSLVAQLDRLHCLVGELPRPPRKGSSEEERLALDAATRLRLVDPDALSRPSLGGGVDAPPATATERLARRDSLDDVLGAVETLLTRAAEAVDAAHFTHLAPRHLYGAGRPPGRRGVPGGDAGAGDPPW